MVGRGGKKIHHLMMVIRGVHNNKGITFIKFKNENIRVGIELTKGKKFILRELRLGELGVLKNVTTFLAKLLRCMRGEVVGDRFNRENNVFIDNVMRNRCKIKTFLQKA